MRVPDRLVFVAYRLRAAAARVAGRWRSRGTIVCAVETGRAFVGLGAVARWRLKRDLVRRGLAEWVRR
jgi:hypothetical protein